MTRRESAFVRAMMAAKWPTHYLGMNSLSGPSRSLFFIGVRLVRRVGEGQYGHCRRTPRLSAAMDRASLADGELLSGYDSSVCTYSEEYSLRAPVQYWADAVHGDHPLQDSREGHRKDWGELVKMYKDAYEKCVPEAHWAMFESMYGMDNGRRHSCDYADEIRRARLTMSWPTDDAFHASMERGRLEEDVGTGGGLYRVGPVESLPVQPEDELSTGRVGQGRS